MSSYGLKNPIGSMALATVGVVALWRAIAAPGAKDQPTSQGEHNDGDSSASAEEE